MITLPAGAPAQVRSWLIDMNQAMSLGDTANARFFRKKIEKYLAAVELQGGKTIQPPLTEVEKEVAYARRNIAIAGSKLEYRSNY